MMGVALIRRRPARLRSLACPMLQPPLDEGQASNHGDDEEQHLQHWTLWRLGAPVETGPSSIVLVRCHQCRWRGSAVMRPARLRCTPRGYRCTPGGYRPNISSVRRLDMRKLLLSALPVLLVVLLGGLVPADVTAVKPERHILPQEAAQG
jgi:hypothetical protein